MIAGVGVDLIKMARVDAVYKKYEQRFIDKILTKKEQQLWHDRQQDQRFLAFRFAGKEAVAKSLGTGFNHGVTIKDIEILVSKLGRPTVNLWHGAYNRAKLLGLRRVHVSFSDDDGYALAFAIAEAQD